MNHSSRDTDDGATGSTSLNRAVSAPILVLAPTAEALYHHGASTDDHLIAKSRFLPLYALLWAEGSLDRI